MSWQAPQPPYRPPTPPPSPLRTVKLVALGAVWVLLVITFLVIKFARPGGKADGKKATADGDHGETYDDRTEELAGLGRSGTRNADGIADVRASG